MSPEERKLLLSKRRTALASLRDSERMKRLAEIEGRSGEAIRARESVHHLGGYVAALTDVLDVCRAQRGGKGWRRHD